MRIFELYKPVDEGVNDPHIFKAIFIAGAPGSGKSYVARSLLGGTGLKFVNSDDVYEHLMKKADLDISQPEVIASPQGQETREKAKKLSAKQKGNYLHGRLGLLIDGTGKRVERYAQTSRMLRDLGYDTALLFVNTSLEIAKERNKERPRQLPDEMIEKMWNQVHQNQMKFQQTFGADKFFIIDNSEGLDDPSRAENFNNVYKQLMNFINKPPSHRKALSWIASERDK
jgi:predicted kinase